MSRVRHFLHTRAQTWVSPSSDARWPCPGPQSCQMSLRVLIYHPITADIIGPIGQSQIRLLKCEQCHRVRSNPILMSPDIISVVIVCWSKPRTKPCPASGFLDRANVSTGSARTSNTRLFEFCVWLQNGKWDIAWQAGKFPVRPKTFTKINKVK